jgi:hypothetical protein
MFPTIKFKYWLTSSADSYVILKQRDGVLQQRLDTREERTEVCKKLHKKCFVTFTPRYELGWRNKEDKADGPRDMLKGGEKCIKNFRWEWSTKKTNLEAQA